MGLEARMGMVTMLAHTACKVRAAAGIGFMVRSNTPGKRQEQRHVKQLPPALPLLKLLLLTPHQRLCYGVL